jgi:hypothetical protein
MIQSHRRLLSTVALPFAALGLVAVGSIDMGTVDAQAPGWGSVKGRVVWGQDKLPDPGNFDEAVAKNPDRKHCLERGSIPDERWSVNKDNKGVRWVFVWLAPTEVGGKLAIHPGLQKIKDLNVVMDQPCCRFEPRVVAMREGQVLIARNSSPVAHNFKYGGHPEFNPGGNPIIPPKSEVPIKDLKAHRIPVQAGCIIHPWMKGWIRVFDHPYFAVTDENGAFEIKDAPAGDLRLVVWHEEIGFLGGAAGKTGRPVNIKEGGTTDLGKLEIKLDGN